MALNETLTDFPATTENSSAFTETIQVDSNSMHIQSNTSQSDTFRLGITILYVFGEGTICILIIIGNSLVLRAIQTERKLQTFTNYFVASLATADLLVGAVGIPTTLVAFFGYPKGFIGCLFVNTLIIILTQISIFGLVTISLERYVAIRYPFYYQQNCRKRTALIAIAISWLLAILVGMVPIMGWNLKDTYEGDYCNFVDVVDMTYMVYFNFFGFVLGPLVLMFCLYCYIYIIVREQMKKIASQQIKGNYSPENSSLDHSHTHYTFAASTESIHHAAEHNYLSFGNHKMNKIFSLSNLNIDQASEKTNCELVSIQRRHSENLSAPQHISTVNSMLTLHVPERTLKSPKIPRSQNGHLGSKARKKFAETFRKELRAAKWFAIVIFVFAVCWLPLHIMNTITLLHAPVPAPPVIVAIILSHANSAVNPILYAYSNTKFKQVMIRLILCRSARTSHMGTPSASHNGGYL